MAQLSFETKFDEAPNDQLCVYAMKELGDVGIGGHDGAVHVYFVCNLAESPAGR